MEYIQFLDLLQLFGFPVFITIFMLWRDKNKDDKHREDVKNLLDKYIDLKTQTLETISITQRNQEKIITLLEVKNAGKKQ